MEVRQWMRHPIHAVKRLDSIQHARELMEKYRVNQLPVVVDGRLVGIITDRDLRDAFPSVFDSPLIERRKPTVATTDPRTIAVESVMTPNVSTISPDAPITDAVQLMRAQRIGALPVVEGDRIVGILTRSDILNAFLDLAGLESSRQAGLFPVEAPSPGPASKPAGSAHALKRRGQSA